MQLNTIRQAANRLAVSSATVRRLIAKRELPVVRVGRCVRLRGDDLDALVRRGYAGGNETAAKVARRPTSKENIAGLVPPLEHGTRTTGTERW